MTRGQEKNRQTLFSYISPEQRVLKDYSLCSICKLDDNALKEMHGSFPKPYSETGRPSIPPEQLLQFLLLQIFYTIRSKRLLVGLLHYNLQFRWFSGLSMDDPLRDHSTFSKNMENRNGLVVDTLVTITSGTAEWEAAVVMPDQIPGRGRITVGADKAHDCTESLVSCECRLH